ncbi:hypothetical protein B0H14DRAFT_2583809 [Mycena olivaceomarginata]|nr:hypothetical protein B0H14DRAFT_2583809 [Mycena olivaceomarginata]
MYTYYTPLPSFNPIPPVKNIISPYQVPLPPKFDLLAKFLSWQHPEGLDKSAKIFTDTLQSYIYARGRPICTQTIYMPLPKHVEKMTWMSWDYSEIAKAKEPSGVRGKLSALLLIRNNDPLEKPWATDQPSSCLNGDDEESAPVRRQTKRMYSPEVTPVLRTDRRFVSTCLTFVFQARRWGPDFGYKGFSKALPLVPFETQISGLQPGQLRPTHVVVPNPNSGLLDWAPPCQWRPAHVSAFDNIRSEL